MENKFDRFYNNNEKKVHSFWWFVVPLTVFGLTEINYTILSNYAVLSFIKAWIEYREFIKVGTRLYRWKRDEKEHEKNRTMVIDVLF